MASSRLGSDEPLYLMQENMRGLLGTPVGKVLQSIDDILKEIGDSSLLVSIGDIVTLDLLEAGIIPDISIVDYMTKRQAEAEIIERFSRFSQPQVKINNPPAQITKGLWEAIKEGFENPRKLRIVVEGEEDLASLACIYLAPPGTTVIYGIPNRGASVHHVDDELKQLVKDTLEKMELK